MADDQPEIPLEVVELKQTILDLLSLKEQFWASFYADSSNQNTITSFLDSSSSPACLIFLINANGELECVKPPLAISPSISQSSKGTVVINQNSALSYFDIALKSPLSFLNSLVSNLLEPAIFSSSSHLPSILLSDLRLHFDRLLSSTSTALAALQGKTLLPSFSLDPDSSHSITRLEETISQWRIIVASRISTCLGEGYTHPYNKDLKSFGLVQEVEFWKVLSDDLVYIEYQLNSEESQKLAQTLTKLSSKYSTFMSMIVGDVKVAITRSNLIVEAISPLKPLLQQLEDASNLSKSELTTILVKLPRLVRLFWQQICTTFAYQRTKYPLNASKFSPPLVFLMRLLGKIQYALITTVSDLCSFEGAALFSVEPVEGVKLLTESRQLLELLYNRIVAEKEILNQNICTGVVDNVDNWGFTVSDCLSILIESQKRIDQLLSFFEIYGEFSKLEKVEVGAILQKGSECSLRVKEIHENFVQIIGSLQRSGIDPMEPLLNAMKISHFNPIKVLDKSTVDKFSSEISKFFTQISNWSTEISLIIAKAFDSSTSISNSLRVFDLFKCLSNRPEIKQTIAPRIITCLKKFELEVDELVTYFNSRKENPPLGNNMPPFSGKLYWCKMLKSRFETPFTLLSQYTVDGTRTPSGSPTDPLSIVNHSSARRVVKRCNELLQLIQQYEVEVYDEWSTQATKEAVLNLQEPLLRQDCESCPPFLSDFCFIDVNFDQKLVALLREIRYFKQVGLTIPNQAQSVFDEGSKYRHWVATLADSAKNYNTAISNIRECDYEVFKPFLNMIKSEVENLSRKITWLTPEASVLVENFAQRTLSLKILVTRVATNELKIIQSLDNLKQRPLVSRVKGKVLRMSNSRDLDALLKKITSGYSLITSTAQNIKILIDNSLSILTGKGCSSTSAVSSSLSKSGSFSVLAENLESKFENLDQNLSTFDTENVENEDKKDEKLVPNICANFSLDPSAWKIYLQYLSNLVAEKLISYTKFCLEFLLDQIISAKTTSPLVECDVLLDTQSNLIAFAPGNDQDSVKILEIFELIVDQIFKIGELISKCDDQNSTYFELLQNNAVLNALKSNILSEIFKGCSFISKIRKVFSPFFWIFSSTPQEELNWFLIHGSISRTDPITTTPDYVPNPPTLSLFDSQLKRFSDVELLLNTIPTEFSLSCPTLFDTNFSEEFAWLSFDFSRLKQSFSQSISDWRATFVGHLSSTLTNNILSARSFFSEVFTVFSSDLDGVVSSELLSSIMKGVVNTKEQSNTLENSFSYCIDTLLLLKKHNLGDHLKFSTEDVDDLKTNLSDLKKLSLIVADKVQPFKQMEVLKVKERMVEFDDKFRNFKQKFKSSMLTKFSIDGASEAYSLLDLFENELILLEKEAELLKEEQRLFDIPISDVSKTSLLRSELRLLKGIWDVNSLVTSSLSKWTTTVWKCIDTELMEISTKNFNRELKLLRKESRAYDAFNGLADLITNFLSTVPLIADLRNDSMRRRHWKEIAKITGQNFEISDDFTLKDMLSLELHLFTEDISEIIVKARKEEQIENTLINLTNIWQNLSFSFTPHHQRSSFLLLSVSEEIIEQLENDMVLIQNMFNSRHVVHFVEDVKKWLNSLGTTDSVIATWLDVQKTWSHLQSIFKFSQDIREQLPDDAARFDTIDTQWCTRIQAASKFTSVIDCCNDSGFLEFLEHISQELARCQKSLDDYLDTKRRAFPRFYFISPADLLDILSKGTKPQKVQQHMGKIFDSIARLEFSSSPDDDQSIVIGMHAKDGEYVKFAQPVVLSGQVENWLNTVVDSMKLNLKLILNDAVNSYDASRRSKWIFEFPSQVVLVGSQIWWTSDVNYAFQKLVEGSEDALVDYNKLQFKQITELIKLIQGDLDKQSRLKVMTLCTIEVHSRDVVTDLIDQKVESADNFQWQKQLRLRWDDQQADCFADICDAQFRYSYEYLGNTPRLVITPLTDRCYITLTQSLHLFMGGAPAGPAGTGKTETTKDLGRALGLMVYVFNCSEQMNFKSLGNIFKGLSASGSWGCFDEFNRISVEVLSVVASQVKSILDAVRGKKSEFWMLDGMTRLNPTVGVFITMNPGYAGRTELPENVKSLFRPCSMVIPDYGLIAEIMLMAEGFEGARQLALKFTTLYSLCRELLSKQYHYDWGLRAIKSVLVVAGSLKRAEPHVLEDNTLMRALRDFNLPKIVNEDVEVFMGLISDLFPGLDFPRKADASFEDTIRKCCSQAELQSDCDAFVLKVVQLKELIEVRHSVFILGPPGSGKTCVWKVLAAAMRAHYGVKVHTPDLNPKTQPADELYGYTNPATREWRDGILSKTMRDLAEMEEVKEEVPAALQQRADKLSSKLKNLKKKLGV
ncbi:hypothetical protein RCL1_008953 [Eukaryota sp. TZLM3-RCL]